MSFILLTISLAFSLVAIVAATVAINLAMKLRPKPPLWRVSDDQNWEVFGSYLLNSDTAEGFKSYDVDRK